MLTSTSTWKGSRSCSPLPFLDGLGIEFRSRPVRRGMHSPSGLWRQRVLHRRGAGLDTASGAVEFGACPRAASVGGRLARRSSAIWRVCRDDRNSLHSILRRPRARPTSASGQVVPRAFGREPGDRLTRQHRIRRLSKRPSMVLVVDRSGRASSFGEGRRRGQNARTGRGGQGRGGPMRHVCKRRGRAGRTDRLPKGRPAQIATSFRRRGQIRALVVKYPRRTP